MRAVVIHRHGGPDVLELADMPMPEPGLGQVLIRVHAVGVNPADAKWRSGTYSAFAPVQMPHILGYDVSGTVEAGEGFPPGSRVAAMLDPFLKGGYAEYVCVPASHVAAMPEAMAFETAAAVPCASLAGLQLVDSALDVRAGQRLVITGALGHVGRAALFAAQRRGAVIIAAVGADRAEEALAAGASEIAVLGEPWQGAPFDAAADTIGGSGVVSVLRHVRPGGRIVTASDVPIPADDLQTAPEFYPLKPDADQLGLLLTAVANGDLPLMISRVLPLASAPEAHKLVSARGLRGKIVLQP